MVTTGTGSFYHMTASGEWDRGGTYTDDAGRSMAANASGEPVIVYYDNPTLKIAWNEPDIRYRLLMKDAFMETGDEFILWRLIRNNTDLEYVANECIVLQVAGEFWFYPDWSRTLVSRTQIIEPAADRTDEILNFTWPVVAQAMTGLKFWAAITDQSSAEILGISSIEFQIAGFEQ